MAKSRPPIAVVGMACRLPGGIDSPEAYWEFLCRGGRAIGEVGPDRWATDHYFHPNPQAPGRSYTWSAGVLSNVDTFDARFFGISPREAAQMDPQQRLLLELAWETLEDAGHRPERLAGTDCGVYVGISAMDYADSRLDDPSSADAYFMTGGVLSIAANRVSYALDLHGPSMSIDTACSSSLVALHQACESLARGEIPMALVGGVNMLLTPYPFIGFSKASMLSPTGQCHAFDAAADGYVRGEGGAVLLLKPLSQAQTDGDSIRAVIVASGTNSDGHTSGLSLPNEKAQAALLRSVYRSAEIEPADLRYIEAHGTGTAVGDPIEASAIGQALAVTRDHDDPLPIGSVKTNIGHLEPAAGVAGLLKVILALEHGAIPPSLNFKTPNPNIRFDDLNLRVITELEPLKNGKRSAVMGVNSFGFGGTNAHVVVRQVEMERKHHRTRPPRVPMPLILSARTPEALKDLAAAYRDHLRSNGHEFYDVCYTAAAKRQRFDHRLSILGRNNRELAAHLDDFACGRYTRGIVSGQALAQPAKLALLFSGNGAQWPGMGVRLLDRNPEFRRWIGAVDELFRPLGGFSILDELERPPERSSLHLTEVAQPALFALQVGLLEVLLSQGLQPEAVFGHSVGEVAAAYASGAYTLEQATRVIHERSKAQARTRGQGTLAAVAMPADAVRAEFEMLGIDQEIAAVNSPSSVTVTGSRTALEAFCARLRSKGAVCRMLELDYPFHSRAMEPLRGELLMALAGIKPYKTRIPFVSTVTGAVLESEYLDAEYWWQNVRRPVRLDKAMDALTADGCQVFMEMGPQPIMQGYMLENLRALNRPGRSVATLQRGKDDELQVFESLCASHVLGCSLDFAKLFPVHGENVRLPHYPWQRERLWYLRTRDSLAQMNRVKEHPLLGYRLAQADGIWENDIDTERMPFLADHVIGGSTVFPAAGFIEMALAAARLTWPDASPGIEYLQIRVPLLLENGATKRVRLTLSLDDGRLSIQSHTRLSDEVWTTHVTGRLLRQAAVSPEDVREVEFNDAEFDRIEATAIYDRAASLGLNYGEAFRQLESVVCGSSIGIARLNNTDDQKRALKTGYHLDPTRLDGCFHALIGLAKKRLGNLPGAGYIPAETGRIAIAGGGGQIASARISLDKYRSRSVSASFTLYDAAGRMLAALEDIQFRRVQLVRDQQDTYPVYENVAVRHWPEKLDRAGPLPALKTLAEAATVSFLDDGPGGAERRESLISVERATAALLASNILSALSPAVKQGEWLTRDQISEALGVRPERRAWLEHVFTLLVHSGSLESRADKFRFVSTQSGAGVQARWRECFYAFPEHQAELALAGRCAMHLRGLLSGTVDPEKIVSARAVDRLRELSPGFQKPRDAMRSLVVMITEKWSDARPLRVLEVGLEDDPSFSKLKEWLARAHANYSFVRLRSSVIAEEGSQNESDTAAGTSLSLDGSEEALEAGSFDVIALPYVLYRLDDASAAVRQIRTLLAPGGLLLAVEHAPTPLLDFIHGALPGWWRQEKKSLLHHSSLRNADAWREELQNAGFWEVTATAQSSDVAGYGGALLLARAPSLAHALPLDSTAPRRSFLLLADSRGESRRIADELAVTLHQSDHGVVLVHESAKFKRFGANHFGVNPGQTDDFGRLFSVLSGENKACTDVVHLMGMTLAPDHDRTALLEVQDRRCLSTICMVQALHAAGTDPAPRQWLVTGRAGLLDFAEPAAVGVSAIPSQAPLWGLGRVVANEHRNMEIRLVDLWLDKSDACTSKALAAELYRTDGETEVLLTSEGRYVARMRHAEIKSTKHKSPSKPAQGEASVAELQIPQPGALSQLQWRSVERKSPGPGEVAVRPCATGLNFRDLMFASGLLPEEAIGNGYAGATLGMECAGVVIEVGSCVEKFRVGDEVFGFAPSAFSTRVITKAQTLFPKPENWSFEQAATVPVAFFTALYALKHLSRLEEGERVLVHGATGGVGLAAVQYAQHRGAEIFATAGSEEKRDLLRLLGVAHVFDSRGLEFSDQIMALTHGEGVDVVLNSLSGEALRRSLSVLRPFGRFLELGKRDFFENTRIGLRPFRKNLAYFGIDADQLLLERPEIANTVFEDVMDHFAEGVFKPLPIRTFANNRAEDAFRTMQRAEHIGKLVVSHYHAPVTTDPDPPQFSAYSLRPDASYLVTGGLSGFGLATARWMRERGAKHLVLMGRSGANTVEARAGVTELEQMGAAVHVLQADVTDLKSLERVFRRIDSDLPPLRGLVHSAMVVDDKLVRNLDGNRMRRVLAPKVAGAWNLHVLTRQRELDFFVLYSSATTSFGNPGLGNYVAANTYLESLVRLRRALGLPGTAVAWGPISDSGYLARNDTALQALTAFLGSDGVTARQGFKVLEKLLQADAACGAVLEFDWSILRRALPAADLKRFEEFNRQSQRIDTGREVEQSAKQILAKLGPEEGRAAITEAVVRIVGEILRLSPGQVEQNASIADLGMDSLMALEMHMSINSRLGVNLPVMGLADIPTVSELVDKIIAHVIDDVPEAGARPEAMTPEPLPARAEAGD